MDKKSDSFLMFNVLYCIIIIRRILFYSTTVLDETAATRNVSITSLTRSENDDYYEEDTQKTLFSYGRLHR